MVSYEGGTEAWGAMQACPMTNQLLDYQRFRKLGS
jgi:hypothetical protein